MATSMEEVESGDWGGLGIVMDEVISNMATSWDPCNSPDWDKEKPNKQCILRIKRYRSFLLFGIFFSTFTLSEMCKRRKKVLLVAKS